MIMATTTKTRKEWQPNDKQTAFIEALKKLGKSTLRQVNAYFAENGMEEVKTGSINVLITKQYVATEKVNTPTLTTIEYNYNGCVIKETKEGTKEETAYSYVEPENRITFEKSNENAKGSKANSTEELTDDDLIDMEE